ncbi:S41 family peptidase [Kroppenstedtia eburnea]|uniref:Carboxyl-terminal processing protease n=1 Tax=Kroppenstedtia eburnea TaxID=714067 RepID=A0A1N7JUS1_9BACL|nr:S41 family peptidase [Kroppenstedtia eburnea]EGK10626.1 carboxy-terminal processing protease [Desmospora sp. 8437]SIS52976.1 carboxyl-terminal processing protease [Kroppenstedtia eburnea]
MYMRGRTVALIVVFAVLFSSLTTAVVMGDGGLLSRATGSSFFGGVSSNSGLEDHLNKLKEAYGTIKTQYIGEVDDQKLIDGAIRGMVDSLNDPYSAYMDQKTAKQFHSSLDSTFQGIGAEVTLKKGKVTIVSPFKGSPAEKAGLRPEDQILKVNGDSLEGMDLNEAVSKIKGPKGTKAHLEVSRPGQSEVLNIEVVRDEIPIETVHAEMLDGKIGKLEISQFSTDTSKDFLKELEEMEAKGMKGLVIDVRGNPGGLLPAVVEISEQLVPDQKKIMMTEDKTGHRMEYKSKLKEKKEYPIVILTDKGSASASEILAAALKESGGYKTVGDTTFGKGTVQTAKDFEDGSNLKLTMAKWLTPEGNWIHKKGIKPDVKVKLPDYYGATPPQPDKTLKRDMTSQQVKNLQLILEGLGYRPDRTDGYYSEQTETAVKAFQRTQKLSVTGVVDSKTAMKLQDAYIEMLRKPENDLQLRVAVETLKKELK